MLAFPHTVFSAAAGGNQQTSTINILAMAGNMQCKQRVLAVASFSGLTGNNIPPAMPEGLAGLEEPPGAFVPITYHQKAVARQQLVGWTGARMGGAHTPHTRGCRYRKTLRPVNGSVAHGTWRVYPAEHPAHAPRRKTTAGKRQLTVTWYQQAAQFRHTGLEHRQTCRSATTDVAGADVTELQTPEKLRWTYLPSGEGLSQASSLGRTSRRYRLAAN